MIVQGSMAQALSSSLFQQATKLTDEQTEKLTEYLSDYDTENLSKEDAKAIVDQIKELGITPGKELGATLREAGIDAKSLADQAGVGRGEPPKGPPPPPPPQETQGVSTVDDAIVQLIAEAVETYEAEEDEETTLGSVITSLLEDAGYDTSQPLIDFYS